MSAEGDPVTKPVPVPDEVTGPFWEAANRGVLAIQHCESCDYYVHPPEALCPRCQAQDLRFREVSGRARSTRTRSCGTTSRRASRRTTRT